MIDLYTWGTPNGRKVSIMLEELALPYNVHAINILKDDQYSDEFIAINPNSKIPAIVDNDGPDGAPITIFESGAILMYLAEKMESPLLPTQTRARYQVMQWLMLQMGSVGPMFGQTHHFVRFAKEDVPYARKRYYGETKRLYGVLDGKLEKTAYLAGDAYSIADIATYPWVARFEWQEVDLKEFPAVKSWFEKLSIRPAVEKGMLVPEL
ncbi:MAG: glutathione S-transferase N-terminal domain-containing protein [Rhodospirillales bacterium]|nr:glutathione S-transferase N-terminal domain-containing protein [Rhodospirillales bacterium]